MLGENGEGAGQFPAYQRLYLALGGVNRDRSRAVQPQPREPTEDLISQDLLPTVIRRWPLRQLGVLLARPNLSAGIIGAGKTDRDRIEGRSPTTSSLGG